MASNFVIPLPEKDSSKDRIPVEFTCQRCCQPLRLHSSFKEIDDQTLSELISPSNRRLESISLIKRFHQDSDESSVMRKLVLPLNFVDAESEFMVVDDLSNLPLDGSNQNKVNATVFDLLSDQSTIDHPMCEECTDSLLDQMDLQLTTAEDENKEYQKFLDNLDHQEDIDEDDIDKLEAEMALLQEQVDNLTKEWVEVEAARNEIKKSLKSQEEEFEAFKTEEDKKMQEYCRLSRQILLSEDHLRSMENQIIYSQAQLSKLRNTNVFNATFHIWHNGHFGTINGFRLGRLPNAPVEWTEINVAWGQTVLLLHSLANKIDFRFQKYRLVPYGNHSYIETLENKGKNLPLYCIGGRKYFSDQKFDLAMVAFLDCLQQFKIKIASSDGSFQLPYEMEKGKIIDNKSNKSYSIKISFNTEEQWTKALKFLLTNLKWAVAWISTQFNDSKVLDIDHCDKAEEDMVEVPQFILPELQKNFEAGLKSLE